MLPVGVGRSPRPFSALGSGHEMERDGFDATQKIRLSGDLPTPTGNQSLRVAHSLAAGGERAG